MFPHRNLQSLLLILRLLLDFLLLLREYLRGAIAFVAEQQFVRIQAGIQVLTDAGRGSPCKHQAEN